VGEGGRLRERGRVRVRDTLRRRIAQLGNIRGWCDRPWTDQAGTQLQLTATGSALRCCNALRGEDSRNYALEGDETRRHGEKSEEVGGRL